MTSFNITIPPDRSFAVVSSDSHIPGVAVDHLNSTATKKAVKGHGTGRMTKVLALPHLNAMMIGLGAAWPILAATQKLRVTDAAARNVRDIEPHMPELLRSIEKTHAESEPPRPFAIALLGVIVRRGMAAMIEPPHVRGWMWSSEDDFTPAPLEGRHTIHPEPDAATADYPAIYSAWEPAALGDEVEKFHRLVLANQARAFPDAIGGPFVVARLDAGGIALRTFDEVELGAS